MRQPQNWFFLFSLQLRKKNDYRCESPMEISEISLHHAYQIWQPQINQFNWILLRENRIFFSLHNWLWDIGRSIEKPNIFFELTCFYFCIKNSLCLLKNGNHLMQEYSLGAYICRIPFITSRIGKNAAMLQWITLI